MHGMKLHPSLMKWLKRIGLLNKQSENKYNTTTGVLRKAKNKTLSANPNDRTNNCKQPNQGSKSVRFSSRVQDTKSTTTPSQKAKSNKADFKIKY